MDKNKNGNIWRKKVEKMCVFKEAERAEVKGVPVKKREEGDREAGEMQGEEIGRVGRPTVWILIPILPIGS